MAAKHFNRRAALVGAVLSAAFVAETSWFAERHSLTYDETSYLNLSIQSVHDRRLDPLFMTLGVAPLPALLTYAGPILFSGTRIEPGDPSAGRPDARQLIRAPRFLNSILIGLPLVILLFLWLHRRHGLTIATLGGGLAALSPTLVAHGALATTDASLALFSMAGIAAIAWFATAPGTARLLLCAVTVAAAMSAKYSGVFLLPVAAGTFLMSSVRRQRVQRGAASVRRTVRECFVHTALLVALVLPLWWGGHLFARASPETLADLGGPLESTLWLPPHSVRRFALSLAPVVGLWRQVEHNERGADAFLAGERQAKGWWYYFPLVFLFKSTPAELALALFVLIGAGAGAATRHFWRTLTELDSTTQSLLLASAIFIWLLVTSNLNLGHRYMIPMYPILIIAGCGQLAHHLGNRRGLLTTATVALLLSQTWASMSIAPHFLAYTNGFAGGPENAWRLVADSSLDWGQDLPELRAFLDERPHDLVAMKYFGSDNPSAYGVRADEIDRLKARPEDYTLVALSATYLNGLYVSRDPFKDFRKLDPDAQLGYSIMVYDLRRPEALYAFREALRVLMR